MKIIKYRKAFLLLNFWIQEIIFVIIYDYAKYVLIIHTTHFSNLLVHFRIKAWSVYCVY